MHLPHILKSPKIPHFKSNGKGALFTLVRESYLCGAQETRHRLTFASSIMPHMTFQIKFITFLFKIPALCPDIPGLAFTLSTKICHDKFEFSYVIKKYLFNKTK